MAIMLALGWPGLVDPDRHYADCGELVLDAVAARKMPGADGDEYRSGLLEPLGDPARPAGVPLDEHGPIGLRRLSAHLLEHRHEGRHVAAHPRILKLGEHR